MYAHWPGPAFETPAEIRMLRTLGADLVGMSTVPEAIAAHALGAEVLAISLPTNWAAGMTGAKLSHEEVNTVGEAAAPRCAALLACVVDQIGRPSSSSDSVQLRRVAVDAERPRARELVLAVAAAQQRRR